MILYNTRLEQIIDDVVAYGLKQGLVLDSNEFKALLTTEMRKQNLSRPLFSFAEQNDHYTLSTYNKTKEDLEKDFTVFFKAIIAIYKKLQENLEKYNSLKIHRENQIEDLSTKLRKVLYKYMPLQTYTTFEETLTTLDNIDDTSSVVVDCGKREVSLAKNIQTVTTFDKPRITCTDSSSSSASVIIQNFNNSTGSIFAYVDMPKQSRLRISFDYNASKPIFIGTLDIGFNYIKTESIEILIDGYTILSAEPISKKTIEVNNWVSNLQINFIRKEADQRLNNAYRYFCGLDYIRNIVHDYSQCGVLKTKAIPLQNTTQAFGISVDDYVPANTGIQYEYSLDGKTWNELSKEERYFISDIKQEKREYVNISDPYPNKNFSIKPLYILAKAKKADIDGRKYRNTKLFRYHNQWCVSTYKGGNDIEKPLTDFSPSLLTSLLEQGLIEIDEQDIPLDIRTKLGELDLKTIQDLSSEACLYKLSTYVQAATAESAILAVNNAQEKLPYYIYLNGSLLKNSSEYLIKQGWNLIEIYFINEAAGTETAEESKAEDNQLFYVNLPTSDYFLNILGSHTPMEEQSIEAMRFSKTIDRKKAYCIDSDQNLIVSDKGDNIRYYIVQEYTVDSLDKLYFRATLTSKIKSATPKIYGFNLHEF